MTEKDVAAMLKEWEQLGYDTSGFNLGRGTDHEGESSEGQSRSPWPLAQDIVHEKQDGSFKVSIPDRRGKISPFHLIISAPFMCGGLGSIPPPHVLFRSPRPLHISSSDDIYGNTRVC